MLMDVYKKYFFCQEHCYWIRNEDTDPIQNTGVICYE
jgi:hypothetical protein